MTKSFCQQVDLGKSLPIITNYKWNKIRSEIELGNAIANVNLAMKLLFAS